MLAGEAPCLERSDRRHVDELWCAWKSSTHSRGRETAEGLAKRVEHDIRVRFQASHFGNLNISDISNCTMLAISVQ
jgi:hypothetical protein